MTESCGGYNRIMAFPPTCRAHQTSLDEEIASAIGKLGKDVVRVRYSFGEDSTGDPAVYYKVTLRDSASRDKKIGPVSFRIMRILDEDLHLIEEWGLLAYFNFRSQSDQERLNDPAWA